MTDVSSSSYVKIRHVYPTSALSHNIEIKHQYTGRYSPNFMTDKYQVSHSPTPMPLHFTLTLPLLLLLPITTAILLKIPSTHATYLPHIPYYTLVVLKDYIGVGPGQRNYD